MKESQWRSKLIRLRKQSNPADFIWAMDAKFKAGFPDLYLLVKGIPVHIELKIADEPTKIQEFTLMQLADARALAFSFSLEVDDHVNIICYHNKLNYHYTTKAFYDMWSRPFFHERLTYRIDNSLQSKPKDV